MVGGGLLFAYWFVGWTPTAIYETLFKVKRSASNSNCLANMEAMGKALSLYMDSSDAYPPANRWMDELVQYAQVDDMDAKNNWKKFHCPAVSDGLDNQYGYAFNEALSSKDRPLKKDPNEWDLAKNTPVIFDSTLTSKNARSNPASGPKPGRHDGKNSVLYGDAHVATEAP